MSNIVSLLLEDINRYLFTVDVFFCRYMFSNTDPLINYATFALRMFYHSVSSLGYYEMQVLAPKELFVMNKRKKIIPW